MKVVTCTIENTSNEKEFLKFGEISGRAQLQEYVEID